MPAQRLTTAAESLDGSPLYHFTSFNIERFSQVISDSQIYFSKATDFNDPFELSPIVNLEATLANADARRELVEEYGETIRRFEGDAGVTRHAAELEAARANPDACRRMISNVEVSYALTVQMHYRVYCLSTRLRAVLMWSHYAAKHQGVAFEFASNGKFFGNACKVQYRDVPEPIDPHSGDPEVIYANAFLTKASSWLHENEYRVIGSEQGHLGFAPTSSLSDFRFWKS
jgi:hypothetical protein